MTHRRERPRSKECRLHPARALRHRERRRLARGRGFVAEVAAGIEHLDHAVKTAGAISTGVVGHFRHRPGFVDREWFLADLRRKFREKYPDIGLFIAEGRSANIIIQVREGSLDIAFALGACEYFLSSAIVVGVE